MRDVSRMRRVVKAAVWWARSFRLCAGLADASRYRACRRADVPGRPVELRLRGIPVPLLCRPGTSDPDVLWDTFGEAHHLPRSGLPPDSTILDLGANVGYTAVDFALRHLEGRIVAVELDADNAELAERNLASFGERCSVVRAAVWSFDGEVTYGGDEAWGFHVEPGTSAAPPARTAPAIRMSTLLGRVGAERVHFVKMDIEGAETEALADPGWLDRVDAIMVEVHPPATLESCEAPLRAAGFALVRDHLHGASYVWGSRTSGTLSPRPSPGR